MINLLMILFACGDKQEDTSVEEEVVQEQQDTSEESEEMESEDPVSEETEE